MTQLAVLFVALLSAVHLGLATPVPSTTTTTPTTYPSGVDFSCGGHTITTALLQSQSWLQLDVVPGGKAIDLCNNPQKTGTRVAWFSGASLSGDAEQTYVVLPGYIELGRATACVGLARVFTKDTAGRLCVKK